MYIVANTCTRRDIYMTIIYYIYICMHISTIEKVGEKRKI